MCRRADERVAFGRPLAEQGVVRDWIAESRVRIEQLRLLVLKTAWLMDTVGNKGAHTEIQAIKIAMPATVQWILDKAIQVHGAGGLSARTSRWPSCGPAAARCAWPTAPTRCTGRPWPSANCAAGPDHRPGRHRPVARPGTTGTDRRTGRGWVRPVRRGRRPACRATRRWRAEPRSGGTALPDGGDPTDGGRRCRTGRTALPAAVAQVGGGTVEALQVEAR